MAKMSDFMIDLFEEIKEKIDLYMDGAAFVPNVDTICSMLSEYFIFEEIDACYELIEDYLNEYKEEIYHD